MTLATVFSRAQNGLAADLVTVEVHLAPGLPGLSIVGLPEAAVRESRDRVRAAVLNSGYQFPNRRITVNLAPADLPKEGGRFDLPIALGVLAAAGQIPLESLGALEVLGELSLTGEIRPVRGALPAALKCSKTGRRLLVPEVNGAEAQLAPDCEVAVATQLGALCSVLHSGAPPPLPPRPVPVAGHAAADLADVAGQFQARRALEIAAAGGHSLLMSGPPGSGKSMLATRLPGILPPLTEHEALEVAAVASVSLAGFNPRDWGRRPYRAPHHTASGVALVGGGADPRPGEITLAHHGVLFLDELPEFDRRVLEVLREPLESGQITVSRAARQTDFPASFQLVAAMNP
ncbi:MAG: YifB family Mg chelatase-like AAA ATPase [Nevskia sp.]|nr:YifB family Mg chelatase-like AAA ATPase [Nevskia sp.]